MSKEDILNLILTFNPNDHHGCPTCGMGFYDNGEGNEDAKALVDEIYERLDINE